jgi:hypothetical protein
MAKQILLEDVLDAVNKAELRKLMLYHEAYPNIDPGRVNQVLMLPCNMHIFHSELRFAQFTVQYDLRGKKRIVDRPMSIFLTINNPTDKTSAEFSKLYLDLLDNGVKAEIDKNNYAEKIKVAYSPDENGLNALKKDMNTIYHAIGRYDKFSAFW